MGDDWLAARRLVSAFHCGDFVAVVDQIDTAGRWNAVARASVGEVCDRPPGTGSAAQDFLDQRLAAALDRDRQTGEP